MVRKRGDVLPMAVLALLTDGPLHGYEVRRRLDLRLGAFRALSYGTLYPCLHSLQDEGCLSGRTEPDQPGGAATKRARVVYEITDRGRERLADLLEDTGPAAWEDDSFGVRLALFQRIAPRTRLRVLEGRRARLVERAELLASSIERSSGQLDTYALEARRHRLETVRSEVAWLDRLITAESRATTRPVAPATTPTEES